MQIIDRLLKIMIKQDNREEDLQPWVRGFQGVISKAKNGFVSTGLLEQADSRGKNGIFKVTELPVGECEV